MSEELDDSYKSIIEDFLRPYKRKMLYGAAAFTLIYLILLYSGNIH